MRRTHLAAAFALALAATAIAVVAPPAPHVDAAGTPPACPFANNNYTRCSRNTTVGPLGSIGLVGDSVLLGSADGMSTPSLPTMLASRGWGPINLVSSVGMWTRNTSNSNASGQYQVKRWHDYGFHPDVIAVNLGANHLGTCTVATTANCLTWINYLLDTIAQYHPNARIWWARTNHEPYGAGNGYSAGMLGWNAALDLAAASRPHMVLWDWPTALATANPPILTDPSRVHPNSGPQYVKRSTLMADHISQQMGAATYIGPRVGLPAAAGDPLGYEVLAPQVAYDSALEAEPVLAAGTITEVDIGTLAPGTEVADVILSTSQSAGAGWLTAWRCGDTQPVVSSLNFATGTPRTAQALVRVSGGGTICVYNSAATALQVYLSGAFSAAGPQYFTAIAPQRPLDTRNTGKAAALEVTVPVATSVAVTVTVTGTSSGGTVALRRCDDTGLDLPVLAYQPNETAAGAAFAAEWAGGSVCLTVNATAPGDLPHVILDVTGTFSADGDLAFVPTTATRLMDTRSVLGGWYGRHGTAQVIDVLAAPPGAKAVSGTITIVRPMFKGWLTAYACGQALPPTSSVNAAAGIVMANSLTVGINEATQTLCIRAQHSTHTLFDAVGWWVDAPPPLAM